MIIYLADRNLQVHATASTHLPSGLKIISDVKTDSVETGTKIFECTILMQDSVAMQEYCKAGNFLLRSADDGNEFYTIIETELNGDTIHLYCEDAGLDLLNTVVPAYTQTGSKNIAWYLNYYLTNYAPEWEIGPHGDSDAHVKKLSWDDETTLTERLLSIASTFGMELCFSYEIEGLKITKKYVDIYYKRGNNGAVNNYYINREIQSITKKESVAELATALIATGGTLKGKNKPINLSGCDYSSDGENNHTPAVASDDYQIVGKQVRCISAMEKWANSLDPDGLLVRQYSYDTTDTRVLFSNAVAELKKLKDANVTYDVAFNSLPDVMIGDYINVVDDKDEIYVTARVLKIEISVTEDTVSAELGEFLTKGSGISDRLRQLAEELRAQAIDATVINISSSNGTTFPNTSIYTVLTATVYYGDTVVTNQTDLEDVFGSGVAVKWYNSGSLIDTGFSTTVSSNNTQETINAKVEV